MLQVQSLRVNKSSILILSFEDDIYKHMNKNLTQWLYLSSSGTISSLRVLLKELLVSELEGRSGNL